MNELYIKNKAEFNRKIKICNLKKQLSLLSEDIVQFSAGVNIPNIEAKKEEFKRIHGEIRELEGKPKERRE